MKIKMKTILITGYSILTIILLLSFAYAILQMKKIDKEVSGSIAIEAIKSEYIEIIQYNLAQLELASVIISEHNDSVEQEAYNKVLFKAKQDIETNISKLDRI